MKTSACGVACLLFVGHSTARADSCEDVLKGGIFNKTTLSTSTDTASDYKAWLCSTTFKTHNEAISAGLGVGVPVYGVPLKVDATFTKEERDWVRILCDSGKLINFANLVSEPLSGSVASG